MQNFYEENMTNYGTNIYSHQGFDISFIIYRNRQLVLPKC